MTQPENRAPRICYVVEKGLKPSCDRDPSDSGPTILSLFGGSRVYEQGSSIVRCKICRTVRNESDIYSSNPDPRMHRRNNLHRIEIVPVCFDELRPDWINAR